MRLGTRICDITVRPSYLILLIKHKGLFLSIRTRLIQSARQDLLHRSRLSHEIRVVKSTRARGGFLTGEVRHNSIDRASRARVGPLCGGRIDKGCHEKKHNTFIDTVKNLRHLDSNVFHKISLMSMNRHNWFDVSFSRSLPILW